jgi:hypothetical protein
MRLVDGQDLRSILRASAPLELERVVTIVGQVGDALDAAHARGLVHRDVKPGNILVARSNPGDPDFCYLTDFGVSGWTTSSAGTVSSTDHMVGSLNYAAPEQIEGSGVHASADRYSLGCVLLECLTGRAPFAGRNPAATLYAQLHEEPPRPSSVRPDLPPAVDDVVRRALRKAPEDRYPSCRALATDLRAALAGRPSSAPPAEPSARPGAPRPRPRWPWIAAAALVTVIVVTLAGIGLADRHGGGPTGASSSGSPSDSRVPERIQEGVQVTASKVALPSKDAAGHRVTYLPGNVVDGDVATAWRAPGNGRGVTITLVFSGPVDIVKVGLIPGYAKVDPETSANRFEQDRIITEVRYLIEGLPPTIQHLQRQPYPQYVAVNATTTQITLEIVDTTRPGGLDFTAISEIYVYGLPQ